jgi:hypothetical protein
VAAPGNPDASGYSANLPPHQWACAPAGSKGPKKTLIKISASLFSLPGTSPDIPVVWCIQFRWSTTDVAEIRARHSMLCVATCLQHRTREVRVQRDETGEQHCPVRTLRTTQWWHPRSWRKSGRRARLKPGCPIRACRFKSCRAHFVVSSVRDGTWETYRIQAPVPLAGRARSTPAGRRPTIRVVGEIAHHSWLLPLNSGFDSRAAHI